MKERIAKIIQKFCDGKKEWLAKDLRVSSGNVADWVSGKCNPSKAKQQQICSTYGVSVAWLVLGEGEMLASLQCRSALDRIVQRVELMTESVATLRAKTCSLAARLARQRADQEVLDGVVRARLQKALLLVEYEAPAIIRDQNALRCLGHIQSALHEALRIVDPTSIESSVRRKALRNVRSTR